MLSYNTFLDQRLQIMSCIRETNICEIELNLFEKKVYNKYCKGSYILIICKFMPIVVLLIK